MSVAVGSHPLLNTRPDFVQNEPQAAKAENMARFYEAILKSHDESPEMIYVKARLAYSYISLGATGSAIELAQEIQAQLADMDIQDVEFDSLLDGWDAELEAEAVQAAADDMSANTYQAWTATKNHPFPRISILPGHDALRSRWQSMFNHGSEQYRTGLAIANAIETNHIEGTFLITANSAQDLIRHGVAQAVVEAQHQSEIQEPSVIRSIVNDTLAAYEIAAGVKTNYLSADKVSEVHSRLMETARFHGSHYVPPGDTRTVTRNTVFVNTPTGRVKFCPYTAVDSELVVICQSAKAYIDKNANPFAVASWLHLVLARCHPFDDGNGRVTRLVASIPLLRAGYPPISISLDQRSDYLQAINKAYDGDHGPFMQCILDGMVAMIERVEQLKV